MRLRSSLIVVSALVGVAALMVVLRPSPQTGARPTGDEPLLSGDVATWREAAVHRGLEGVSALPVLEALARDPSNADRVALALDVALRRSVRASDLSGFPTLQALVELRVATARRSLVLGPEPHTFRVPMLDGFAAPVAMEMLEQGKPEEQVLALRALQQLRATVAMPRVQGLTDAGTFVRVWNDDSFGRLSIAKEATTTLESFTRTIPQVPCLAVEGELLLGGAQLDLTNEVRQLPAGLAATTSKAYWDAARPLWRLWWRLAGDAGTPDRNAWLDAKNARHGFRFEKHVEPRGHSFMHLRGPRDVTCTVTDASGPLTTSLPFDREADPQGATTQVQCGNDAGVAVASGFFVAPGEEWTLTILPKKED